MGTGSMSSRILLLYVSTLRAIPFTGRCGICPRPTDLPATDQTRGWSAVYAPSPGFHLTYQLAQPDVG